MGLALTPQTRLIRIVGWFLLMLGIADATFGLIAVRTETWVTAVVAASTFAALGLFWWRDRFDPVPLDALPDSPLGSRVAPATDTLLRTAPFLLGLTGLAVAAAVFNHSDATFVGAFFAAWGVQELRLLRQLRRWEARGDRALVVEMPRLFVVGRIGREYRARALI